ncbi:MAG: hypothetical protein Crog4KO_34160 [Crocinitomicaceae bacterium]
MSTTLYAWANALSFPVALFDHTFVTDYDFTNGEYPDGPPAGSNYWYCWGIYHPSADHGNIAKLSGDDTIAANLVSPNIAPPAFPGGVGTQDGSIEYYGVDGVCHMVANQVLFATGTSTSEPALVTKANGYRLSSFLYTDYGLNTSDWDSLKNQFASGLPQAPDSFSIWLLTLGFTLEDMAEVEAERVIVHEALQLLRTTIGGMSPDEAYAAIGAIILTSLYALDKSIGWDNLQKLFPALNVLPSSPEEAAFVVDKDQLANSLNKLNAYKATQGRFILECPC